MKKKLLFTLLAAAFVCFAALSATGFANYNANAEVWSGGQIESAYRYGSDFAVPEKTVTVGGNTVKATAVVVFPDGSSTYAGKVVLNQTGVYSVVYAATAGGKTYAETYEFTVSSPLFSHSDKSSVTYGADAASESTTEGLIVSLAQGDELTFNHLINVSDLTADTTLVNLFALTNTVGVAEFSKLIIKMYDAENPDIYVKIEGRRRDGTGVDDYGNTFVYAGANGQDMVGVGDGEIVHKNDTLGRRVNHSFDRRFRNYEAGSWVLHVFPSDYLPMDIRYDGESKGIYIEQRTYTAKEELRAIERYLVTDLDNPNYYSKLFAGFPSGKIKLGISADAYSAATARFCVADVFGADLTNNILKDENAPVITVDTEYAEMPEAVIGRGYAVPTATATDDYSGNCDVKVKVYYDYTSDEPVSVNIRDGKFIPTRKGYYAIVYTATDGATNKAEKVLWVHAGGDIPALTATVLAGTYETRVSMGETVLPAEISVTGGSGNAKIDYYASTDGVEEISANEGFVPEKEGTWTVRVVATDYVGNTAPTSYTVEVVRSDLPILAEEVVLQKIYVAGAAYVLPVAYAKDYSTGVAERKLCEVEVEDASGKKTYKAGEKFVPTVTGDYGVVKVSYKYNGTVFTTENVPVIRAYTDDSSLLSENYFYGDGITKTATADGMSIKSTQKADKIGFLFANTLLSEGLTFDLKSIATRTNFDEIRVTLTDAEYYGVSATARLINNGDHVVFAVGNTSLRIEKTFSEVNEFPIGYKNGMLTLDKTEMKVETTDIGEAFGGFGEKVYLSVEFLGAKPSAEILVVSLNDCPFTQVTDDVIAPKYVINGASGGSGAKDSIYVLPSISAGDVFSPNVTATLSVRDANNKYVTDENGLLLKEVDPYKEYSIKLTEYGRYRVTYNIAEDADFCPMPNEQPRSYSINVYDETAPTITLTSGYTKNVKVGEYIILPDFEVNDNVSATDKITVIKMVINPNGRQLYLAEGSNSVHALYEGVYEIRLVATDELGNTRLTKLYVNVTK